MIGQTLRHYRIEAKLGEGGMGVVYRAVDTHLDRTVALKVLPPSALANADRKARFVQEAKAASALNHPNIITIHDIDSADGIDFIAMEYVPGKTLDRLAGRRGLKLPEALKCAIQIAEALSAAHAAGIIHRDLKPANVMVTEQGLVKVLDFGLAKLSDPAEPDAFALTQSMQVDDAPRSEIGTVVGTAAYMSPEQAEGKKVDARSDIFSFGAVMYEMLAGRRAFAGDSRLSILTAVLHKDPPPLGGVIEGVPRDVEKIIARCLKKEPQRRWQTVPDLKIALEEVLEESERGEAFGQAAPARARRGIKGWLWPALAGLLLGAGIAGYAGKRLLKPNPPSFHRLTFRRGDVTSAKFAPDGQTIVYTAAWDGNPAQIFSTRLGGRESRPLGLPEGKLLSVSPSGELAILVGNFATSYEKGTLARVPLAGGAPREILEDVIDADWTPDGNTLAVVRIVAGKNRVEFPVGKVLYETDGRPPLGLRISPKGEALAFFDFDNEVGDYAVSVVGADGKKRTLSKGWRAVAGLGWSPNGDEIWFSGGNPGGDPAVYAISLAGQQRVLAHTAGWMILHDIARDRRMLMTSVNSRIGISCLPPGETKERELSWFDSSNVYELSRDGKLLLFVELSYGQGRNPAIYLRKTDGSPAIRLGDGGRPSLSPDGKWVVCIRSDPNSSQLVLLPTGAGEPQRLTTVGMRYESAEWFPDGRRILFTGNEPNRAARTFMQDLAGGRPRPITPEGTKGSRVSPDGQYLVVPKPGKLYLNPIDGGEPRLIGPLEPGESVARWSSDGQFLFLRHAEPGQPFLKVYRLHVSTGRRELWRELKPPDPVGVLMRDLSITPDGNSYAYSFQRDLADLYLMQGLK